MRIKKVKIPRVIDLGCNYCAKAVVDGSAKAVVDAKGNALFISFETPIAYAEAGHGTRRELYRLMPSLGSPMVVRHWAAFVRWEGHPELADSKSFNKLPLAQIVA